MEQKLLALLDERQQRTIDLLRELVRINTTNPYSGDAEPGGEMAGQQHLQPILNGMGAETVMFDCPDDIYERTGVIGPQSRDFTDRPNLVATWDFGGDGPTVIVNGHMDTVGIDTYRDDPLSAAIADGRMLGRGTSDCKGGICTAVSAIDAVLDVGRALQGKLVFQSVVDEECNGGGAGTLACLDAGYTGDMAVFVDGEEDTITVGCNGVLTAALDVEGQAGHAALGTGVNAIEKAGLIQQAILDFKRVREERRPGAKLNLGLFRGGIHPAVVPAEAWLEMNMVYEIDEAQASRHEKGIWGAALLRQDFERHIRAAEQQDDGWLQQHPAAITWIKDLVPFSEEENQPLVQRLIGAHKHVSGRRPTIDRMVAWSDACWPSAYGDIHTVLYGPAAPEAPHTDYEFVSIASLLQCTKVLALFLLRQFT
jgi:acetylornithine deacetylase